MRAQARSQGRRSLSLTPASLRGLACAVAFHAPPRGAWARQSECAQAFGTSQPLVSAWKKRLQLLERREGELIGLPPLQGARGEGAADAVELLRRSSRGSRAAAVL